MSELWSANHYLVSKWINSEGGIEKHSKVFQENGPAVEKFHKSINFKPLNIYYIQYK